ncbi:hypothetical protein [Shouchella clausii]|uniref:hypothetical protein n=1 Tax=Shouchella clausii TaxID=79880 RepID=UPI0015CC0EEB|nr:hypothetical protein [Shouchella clausii]
MKTFMFYIKEGSRIAAAIFAILYVLNVVEFEYAALLLLLAILNNLGAKEKAE